MKITPGLEGSALLALGVAPVAATGAAFIGLAVHQLGAPLGVVPGAIVVAVLTVIWRVTRVAVVVSEHRIEIRNILGTSTLRRAEVEGITTKDFHGGPRPLPVLALLSSERSARPSVKLQATARISKRGRERLARLLGDIAPQDQNFGAYLA